MEHLAYMNGERDADADFGPEESHLETATSAVGTTSLTSSTEPRPLARPPSPLPPLGKDACYLARKAAEAKKKRVAGKKKMTKRQEAELRREEKKAKDERGRAEHAAAARSAQKKNERERATLVEQRGRQTRDKAILQLSSKAPAKRKGTSKPGSRIAKRPKNASRQFADTEEDADADDKGAQGTQGSAGIAPPSDGELSATGPPRKIETGSASSRQAVRSLCMDSTADDDSEDSGVMQAAPVTRSPDGAALNSDVEGDIESDDWYTETEVTTTSDICSGGEDAVTQHAGEEEDVDCDPSEDNEGGTDGDALLLREKNLAKRQQLQERLAAAKAKLSRDWATTTKN
ncbi:hypothetical protein PC129_g18335 [Phytophthora cactorum]|uniref:Uncharacterized protein n=1 Tax=Phytophthora cactorum TaxID=29920 RepID=A0A8T1HF34_9STRA|nr:hypothetical protein PC111_g18896 [Phytophthora cactorum]KAG2839001.1 hypothetical protein PC113_g19559 [Phytophthora cactorum]KAG2881395.1 hypothetical protein PC114_g21578 [Phytophthora cactorum]KAG2912106.1 hypothetical protein PC117_g18972 [Phytophthora cactorum]KAG2966285.1 hypothetical protein PC118_g19274 [Phytophthora cactorum]